MAPPPSSITSRAICGSASASSSGPRAPRLTALVALSIGIGLSGMMFSLIRGGLLPTLPFPNGERMVRVQHEDYSPTPPELYAYWTERQRSFEGLGASSTRPVSLIMDGVGGEPVSSAAIDVGTLPLLSVEPVMGRRFTDADAVAGAPKVALIGFGVWQSRMDGDPDVLGRTIRMSGEPATIIGVMPEGFGFPFNQQLWTPLGIDELREAAAEIDPDVAVYYMRTLDEAIAAANASFAWLSALSSVAGVLALFLAAIGLYGVMAFWVSQRSREIGVRMAVGGGGGRIVGFVLAQGLGKIALGLLAGALLSLPVAWGLRGVLLDVSPFDPLVFGSVLGVLLAAGALGCALPALRATRVDPLVALGTE